MTGPDRRAALQALGAGAALPIAGTAAAQPARGLSFFSEADVRFVAAAVDRFIPADEYPSASQAGVVVYIDRQLAGPFGRGERMYLRGPVQPGAPEQGYQLGLAPAQVYRESLDALLGSEQGRGFADRTAEQQDGFLKELETGIWMLGSVPSAVFFETLLANTVEGYFADPAYGGNRDMAGWRMIGFPGAYANYVQWVGRHNVRFNRPPVAIASSRTESAHEGHSGHGAIPASARPARRQEQR